MILLDPTPSTLEALFDPGPSGVATRPAPARRAPSPNARPLPFSSIQSPPPARPRPTRPQRRRGNGVTALTVLAVLVGEALLLTDVRVPVVRPVLGIGLLVGLPVLVMVRRLLVRLGQGLVAFLVATGLAVLGVIVVALGMNTALPWLGVGRPLDRPGLVVASAVIDVGLVLVRRDIPLVAPGFRARLAPAVLSARTEPAVALGVAAVVLAIAGAIRLNNGLGGGVAVAGHAAAVLSLGAALIGRRGVRGRDGTALFLSGSALLLGTSLRGWYITGHDIQNEYLSYLFTHDAGHWVMSTYPTPYNACLSVNILPQVVGEMTGTSGVWVFKILMQLLFAVVPLVVYAWARRILTPRPALLSAALFVFFPTFFTDMPYLVRQEVAYLFAGLALLVSVQPALSVRTRRALALAFGIGVVLSHYSTTYVLVITLVAGASGLGAGGLWRRWEHRRGRPILARTARQTPRPRTAVVLLSPLVVLGVLLSAWLWTSPATHSGGHLVDTVGQLSESIISGNTTAGSSDLQYSPLGGGGPTDAQRFDDYVSSAITARAGQDPDSYVIPDPTGAVAHPPVVSRAYLPLTGLGSAVQAAGVNVRGVNAAIRGLMAALFEAFLGIGVIGLLVRARRTRRIGRELFWLMAGTVAALGAVVAVPGLSADYGVLRAFQQTLLFAAPLLAVGALTVLGRLRVAALPVAAGLAVLAGLVLTGVQPALFGGYYAQLSQSNSGQYYELLYVRSPEISAARWLAGQTKGLPGQTVAASDIVSVTRLQSILPRSVAVDGNFLPIQLRTGSYVFLTPQTVDDDHATVFYTGNLITYRYPTGALDRSLDLVYSTSGARVYR